MATPTPAQTKKRLALAVIDFLQTSGKDGTVSADDAESLEVAQQCIADSFGVDPTDSAAVADALGGQNLVGIYGVYEKLKGRGGPGADQGGATGAGAAASPGSAPKPAVNPEAEAFKSQGNAAMQAKDYAAAVDLYSRALALAPLNAVYLSNRAAAHSAAGQHAQASTDAEQAVAADPKYTKAWSRLGLARFALGDARGSLDAYSKGIEYEGSGGSPAMKKGYETAKKKVEEDEEEGEEVDRGAGAPAPGGMPDLSSLAGMLGGGGGGGGMPDLGGLMNNPMFANMAQNLMSNPDMMSNIMNNPNLRRMAENFGGGAGGGGEGGGGMPDMAGLMNDPSIAEMARNLMGGGGGAGPGAGRGAGGAGRGGS